MFPSWGHDIDKRTTPFHLNQENRVDFNVRFDLNRLLSMRNVFHFQKDFIGKTSLSKESEEGIKKRFTQFILDDHNMDTDPW